MRQNALIWYCVLSADYALDLGSREWLAIYLSLIKYKPSVYNTMPVLGKSLFFAADIISFTDFNIQAPSKLPNLEYGGRCGSRKSLL